MKKILISLFAAALCFSLLILPVSAERLEEYPRDPQQVLMYQNTGFVIADWNYWGDSDIHYFLFSYDSTSPFIQVKQESTKQVFTIDFDTNPNRENEYCEVYHYVLDLNINDWVLVDSHKTFEDGIDGIGDGQTYSYNQIDVGAYVDVHYSSHDIFSSDGTLFFEGTPIPYHLTVTRSGITIPREIMKAVKILVPCGVGLIALLIGLSLFGKRLLIFPRK